MDNLNLKFKNFHNLAIYGKVNSGKCSLAKSLTFACQNIDTPNNFRYKGQNYFILPIPCSSYEFKEKYDFSSNMCEIAIIVLDALEMYNNNYCDIINTIFDLSHKGIKHVVICFNKIEILTINNEIFHNLIKDLKINLSIYQNCFNKNITKLYYIPISAKESINLNENMKFQENYKWYEGESLLETLNKIIEEQNCWEIHEKINKFLIYDFYNDEDFFVISGKILSGEFKINQEYNILPINKKLKLLKICDCEGNYIDIVYKNQFVSYKFDLNIISSDDISRGDIITQLQEEELKSSDFIYPIFNTFEADVFFYTSSCATDLPNLISSGFNCFINFNISDKNCIVDNILGEYGKKYKLCHLLNNKFFNFFELRVRKSY
jgi:translation elongation factor EF-1alpha